MKKLADISKFESLINNSFSSRNAISNGIGVTYKEPGMAYVRPDMTEMMMRTMKPDYVSTPKERSFVHGKGGPTDVELIRKMKGKDYDPSRDKKGEEQYRPMDLAYRNNFMLNDIIKQILDRYANRKYINYDKMSPARKELLKEYFFTKRARALQTGEVDEEDGTVGDGRDRRAYLGDADVKEYLSRLPMNHISSQEPHTPQEHNRNILGSRQRPWTIEELIDRVYYDALQDPRYETRRPGAIRDTSVIRKNFDRMHQSGELPDVKKLFGLGHGTGGEAVTPHDESGIRPQTLRGEMVERALELAGRRYDGYRALLDDANAGRTERGFRVRGGDGGNEYTSDINIVTGKPKPRRQTVTKRGYSDARRDNLPKMSPDETYDALKACADAVHNGDMTKTEALRWIKFAYGLSPEDVERFAKSYAKSQKEAKPKQSNQYRLNNLPSDSSSAGAFQYRRKQ